MVMRQLREQLKTGLSLLPAPKNDYEIVVPEDETMETSQSDGSAVEDQADVDARFLAEQKAKREKELKSRSQVVQRDLPRPMDVNSHVLRPAGSDLPFTDLQRVSKK